MVRLLIPLLLLMVTWSPAKAAVPTLDQKIAHYCRYWGSAGLFPDDEAKLADNPLARIQIPLQSGGFLEFELLYIFKGYELDEQPKEWAHIWEGFRQACPGWQKPEWLVKLEAWQAANKPKEDPRIARSRARIKELQAMALTKEETASKLRARITTSPDYLEVTGGKENWLQEAQQESDYLDRVVSLDATRYVVIGRLEARSEGGFYIQGMAIAPRGLVAPGTMTTPARIFISNPRPVWLRDSGDFLADDALLLGLVDAENTTIVFGPELPKETKAQVAKARASLKRIKTVLKGGQTRILAMLKPVDKLEKDAVELRAQADRLEAQLAGPK